MIAANHPSYLDPILLSLQVERPIRFMAWDALFRHFNVASTSHQRRINVPSMPLNPAPGLASDGHGLYVPLPPATPDSAER